MRFRGQAATVKCFEVGSTLRGRVSQHSRSRTPLAAAPTLPSSVHDLVAPGSGGCPATTPVFQPPAGQPAGACGAGGAGRRAGAGGGRRRQHAVRAGPSRPEPAGRRRRRQAASQLLQRSWCVPSRPGSAGGAVTRRCRPPCLGPAVLSPDALPLGGARALSVARPRTAGRRWVYVLTTVAPPGRAAQMRAAGRQHCGDGTQEWLERHHHQRVHSRQRGPWAGRAWAAGTGGRSCSPVCLPVK